MSKELFIQSARELIGVKWRHQGRSPWAVDCVGLVVLSLEMSGRKVSDNLHYNSSYSNADLLTEMDKRFKKVDYLRDGCIATFGAIGKMPTHIGIIAHDRHGDLSLIHSRANSKVMEHRMDNVWVRLKREVYDPWV